MKTILLATDFSNQSAHVNEYGYELARQIRADVILCNAVMIPADIPEAGNLVWPVELRDSLMDDSSESLKHLKKRFEHTDRTTGFHPMLSCNNNGSSIADITVKILAKQPIELIVMGTHDSTQAGQLFLEDHTSKMIDKATIPLILVPPGGTLKRIKKIGFAIDGKNPEDDLERLYALIPLARQLEAEILIIHIFKHGGHAVEALQVFKDMLTDIANKANYPNIFYRIVDNDNTENGLDWLSEHGQIDMLAMVHREHGFFSSLFVGSYSQKMAGHIKIPLMVIPA